MPPIEKVLKSWLPYAPIGNQVPGTRFIAFKVPLREAFVDKLQADDRFTIGVLLDKVPDLGLVIDLTHTTKYYNKSEFLDRGVDYVKIQTPGQIVPPQNLVERFFEVVDYFLDAHKNDNLLIGVHCTHGVNRTGYMLCRYLIQRLGYSFTEAVEAVGRARGHMIERSPYLSSLEEIKAPELTRPNTMRPSGAKSKSGKKEEVVAKKEESRRNIGKDGFRGDYHASPGRVSMVPGRTAHRGRSRTPPPQQHPRGRDSPIPVGGRSSPLQPIRNRRSPPHYDRPMTGQPRISQQSVMRDRMPPPNAHGRSPPPPPRGRTPPHSFRSRTPPPPSLHISHHSPTHIRGRSPPVIRNRSPTIIRRSPPRPQGRGRSPLPEMMNRRGPVLSRGRSPPSHMRGRSPPNMRGSSPPGHMRSRSPPGRGMRRRTPTHYGRVPSPSGHEHMPVTMPPSPPGHGHISRRDLMPHGSGRSQPPGRGRSPPRRERTPPSIQSSRRPSSPDYRRNEPPMDRHYSSRPSYEEVRRGPEESARDFNERFHSSSNQYGNEKSYGAPAEYYPERYEKIRRERTPSPRRNHSYYPYQRDEVPVRTEFSPSRETKRRRKTPPPVEVREKIRRSTPPSGYMNSRDGREGFKKDKREYPSVPWDVKEKDPDCREILNEKRSMRDIYPDINHGGYSDVPKYAPMNADLRDALEEEKRRRHGHGDPTGYHGQDMPPEDRNVIHQGYSSHEYPHRSESEMVRGRSRQDYPGGSSNNDGGLRNDIQRHHGYQDSAPYPEPKHHRSQGEYVKPRDDEFRKPRGRRNKRVFDRLSRGGRGRGGGYWP